MECVVAEWLKDPPYTRVNKRLRPLIMLLTLLEPSLSYTFVKRQVMKALEEAMKGPLGHTWTRDRCVRRTIRVYGMNDQRTSAWHAKRGEMVTASEVSGVFTGGETRRSLIIRKLEPPQPKDGHPISALIWGTRFESIAKAMYEAETQCRIVDVSCVQHSVHTFLGASPDGIIFPNDPKDVRRRGRLVEFKCPISRDFDETTPVPSMYIHQMQLQMACADLDACDYAELKFKVVNYSEWMDTDVEHKSAFLAMTDGSFHYRDSKDVRSVVDWKNETLKTLGCEDQEMYQLVWWVLVKSRFQSVDRDPEWMTTNLPFFEQTWKDVLEHREKGTLPEPLKEKTTTLTL